MSEAALSRKCVKWARERGYYAVKNAAPAAKGVPDYLFAIAGIKPVWVEFKSGKGQLTALQEYEIKRMRSAGLTVWVIKHFDFFCKEMKDREKESWT